MKKFFEIKEGMNFYDSLNDRYIKVESIDRKSKTAMCIVEESDYDEETGEELASESYYQLFNLRELLHFEGR